MQQNSFRDYCPNRRRRLILRGYSLLELVVVIAIIAILGAIGLPRFANSLSRHRLQAAARRITSDLDVARRRARLSSTDVTVCFDMAMHRYCLTGLPDPDHPQQEYCVELDEEPYSVRIASVDFDGDAKLVFDGYGTPDSSGTIVITAGGSMLTVNFDAESGEAAPSVDGVLPMAKVPTNPDLAIVSLN